MEPYHCSFVRSVDHGGRQFNSGLKKIGEILVVQYWLRGLDSVAGTAMPCGIYGRVMWPCYVSL